MSLLTVLVILALFAALVADFTKRPTLVLSIAVVLLALAMLLGSGGVRLP